MKDSEGLYQKFEVSRADGEDLPPDATFLVLRLDEHGDWDETQAARSAAEFYARQVNNPTMMKDLDTKFPANSSKLPYRMISVEELDEAHQVITDADAAIETYGQLVAKAMNVQGDS